jgi:hypothetical protein
VDIPLSSRLDGVAAVLGLVYAAVMTAVVVAVSALLDGVPLLVVLGVLTLAWLVHVALFLTAWRQIRQVPFPLGVHGDGVHDRTPPGEVVLAWDAIRSATLERRFLRSPLLTVHPVDPAVRKVQWSLRALEISAEDLRRLFTVQSGGRVQLG